jgi:hypothetical protein
MKPLRSAVQLSKARFLRAIANFIKVRKQIRDADIVDRRRWKAHATYLRYVKANAGEADSARTYSW